MDGFARRKEQSKEEIRKAAWELFSQFGVEKVSMAEIARKAGVSQATIYNNFGSKEALAREFVTRMVEELVQRVQDILEPEMRYSEKMAAFVQFISEVMANRKMLPGDNAVFSSNFALLDDPEVRKIRTAAQEKMTRLLLDVVQEGREQGQVSPDLSDEAIAIYFGVFMDVFTDPKLQDRFFAQPRIVHDLGVLMMNGLRG